MGDVLSGHERAARVLRERGGSAALWGFILGTFGIIAAVIGFADRSSGGRTWDLVWIIAAVGLGVAGVVCASAGHLLNSMAEAQGELGRADSSAAEGTGP